MPAGSSKPDGIGPVARLSLFGDRAWHRRLWRLATPMILSNLAIPLLGAVDTAVMGHLPDPAYLGAVAVGALIFSTLYNGFNFLRMGTTGLTAQAFGAKHADELRAILGRAFLIGGAVALLVVTLQWPIAWAAFTLVDPSAEVSALGREYFFIRVWSAPAALGNIALIGWFIGMQNTRAPMTLLLVVNGVNIVLDLVFVLGLEMAVAGVAWATVIADYLGFALGLAIAHTMLRRIGGDWRLSLVLAPVPLRRFVSVNRDIFVRTLSVIFAFAYFTALSARQGDVVLAANAALMNFIVFINYGLDGFAFAAEALTGRALGERSEASLRRAVRVSLVWSALTALLTAAIYGGLGGPIIRVLTDLPAVRETAYAYLPWVIAMPVVGVWAIFLDGVFTGTTRTIEMRNTMLLAVALFVPAATLLPGAIGNHGLWLAMTLLYLVRSGAMGALYFRIAGRGGFTAAQDVRREPGTSKP